MYYKQNTRLFNKNLDSKKGKYALNSILRFNIGRFLRKADDAMHPFIALSANGRELVTDQYPKVYHLNIIIKNTFYNNKVVFKKFRVILDKNGIKRIGAVRG